MTLALAYAAAVFFRRPWLYSWALERAFDRTRGPLPRVAMQRLERLESLARHWRAKGLL